MALPFDVSGDEKIYKTKLQANYDYLDGQSSLATAHYALSDTAHDGTAWADFIPTVSGGGSMTWSLTATQYRWRRQGTTVFVQAHLVGATGGSASNALVFDLPVAPSSNYSRPINIGAVSVNDSTSFTASPGFAIYARASTLSVMVYKADRSNFGLGAGRYITVSGQYEGEI